MMLHHIAEESGSQVDREGFAEEMERARQRSKEAHMEAALAYVEETLAGG